MSENSSPSHFYQQMDSGDIDKDSYKEEVAQVSKGLSYFAQITRTIESKLQVIGTDQDRRANHEELKEQVEKGKKIADKVKRKLRQLAGPSKQDRSRSSQHRKLTNDFKTQLQKFDAICHQVVQAERHAIDNIRQSVISRQESAETDPGAYNEDQLYAQANITTYDEDDLQRREEDIVQITHQLNEVNAAYKEIDGLVADQEEVVVQIADNTEMARERVENALENVQQADAKTGYINCSKKKLCCYGVFIILVLLITLSLVYGT